MMGYSSAKLLMGDAIMKCDICQGVGELIVVEHHVSGDESTDELQLQPCEHCKGTGELDLPDDLAGRTPRIRPAAIPPRRTFRFDLDD